MKIQHDRMLEILATGGSTPHRFKYVVSQGKNIGQVREYVLYYGAPRPNARAVIAPKSETSGKRRYLQGGLLPFTEFDSGKLLTLFTFNIIEFDGKKVIC